MFVSSVASVRVSALGFPPRRNVAASVEAPVDLKQLKITQTTSPATKPPNHELVFGSTFTDHMLLVPWKRGVGWGTPEIKPFGNLSIHPAASCLHYALELFEGQKAYRDAQGTIRLFRPMENMKRMNTSAERLVLPTFDGKTMLKLIERLLLLDQSWIPTERGYSMYIRPTMIATQRSLGVAVANEALFFTIMSPVGPYYKTGFKPVSLLASARYIRAAHGGAGAYKLGANYGPTIMPQYEASKDGYAQIMWTLDGNLGEVGTMNLFVLWENEKGKLELATPPLDGTILPGVTRMSVLELARQMGGFDVVERNISLVALAKAAASGRVKEVFGAGTAAVISPVEKIHWQANKTDIVFPIDPALQSGPVGFKLHQQLLDIQYGVVEHPWSHKVQK